MLRPAFVAVILVTLAGETAEWQMSWRRVAGVIVGCVCALAVGFLFNKLLKHVKLEPEDQSKKDSSQE
jgi:type IV secretory pathway VirB2 component (pilin)